MLPYLPWVNQCHEWKACFALEIVKVTVYFLRTPEPYMDIAVGPGTGLFNTEND